MSPQTVLETSSAVENGKIKLRVTKIFVNCDYKTYRSSALGSLSVEPDGEAKFELPLPEGEFNLEQIGNIVEQLLTKITSVTIKVFNENVNTEK